MSASSAAPKAMSATAVKKTVPVPKLAARGGSVTSAMAMPAGLELTKIAIAVAISRPPNQSVTIFDINAHYGTNTTQTIALDPKGEVISTIGGLAWRYDRPGKDGMAELYIPVFEARQVHIFSFRKGKRANRVRCPTDITIACPAP